MAKSRTKKKPQHQITEEDTQIIKQTIEKAVSYVTEWKRKQLVSLALKPDPKTIPVCIPITKTDYVIGQYGLKRVPNKYWQIHNSITGKEDRFVNRTSAVVYCICEQTGKPKLAKEVLEYNSQLLRMYSRLEEFKYLQDRACKKKDYWRVDYYTIMAESAEFAIHDAKNQLEKSINLAKYFRIWE